jgi:FkbM family methyltransferase
VRLIERLAQPGGVVADVGASWGLFTHAMSGLVGDGGHVHAFEPNPFSLRRLRATCRWRRNVSVHPHALSDRAVTAELRVPYAERRRIDALATLSPKNVEGVRSTSVQVALRDLDSVVAPDSTRLSLIKCDVEGHEDLVLQGARGQLERWHPALLLEIEQRHRDIPVDHTFRFLEGLGYSGFFLDAERLRPIEQFDLERHQLRYLSERFVEGAMPAGYVHDFLFIAEEARVSSLLG